MANEDCVKQYMEIELLPQQKHGNVTFGLSHVVCVCINADAFNYRLKNNTFCHIPHTRAFSVRRRTKSKEAINKQQIVQPSTAIRWNGFASNDAYTRYIFILCSLYVGMHKHDHLLSCCDPCIGRLIISRVLLRYLNDVMQLPSQRTMAE